MTGVTPSIRLNLPAYDLPGWDTLLNNNFAILDSMIQRVTTVPGYVGVWMNSTTYLLNQSVTDPADSSIWQCAVGHTSSATGLFAADRAATPGRWTDITGVIASAAASASSATTSAAAAAVSVTAAAASATASAASATAAAASATAAAASAAATALAAAGYFRNKVRNPLFTVAQRGAGAFSTNGAYTADGWQIQNTNGSNSTTLVTAADADRTAIGDNEITSYLQNVCVGAGAAGDLNVNFHKIEGVRRLAGKTVTISFWARATSGTPKVGVEISQYFGTGGSPSATATGIGSQAITLSTTWTRYTTTAISIPTSVGKTLGSANDDHTLLFLWQSSGATSNSRAGGIGVQSYTLQLWGVQLEIGSVATAIEKRDPQAELALNQRYYLTGTVVAQFTAAGAGSQAFAVFNTPVTMRGNPTVAATTNTNSNLSAAVLGTLNGNIIYVTGTSTAGGNVTINQQFTASTEL